MAEKFSRSEFVARLGSLRLEELRSAAASEGHELRATSKKDAIEELWLLYSGRLPDPPAAEDAAPSAPVEDHPLVWEGRLSPLHRGQSFRRAGFLFQRGWQDLSPTPTDAQLDVLRAEPMVKIRIKG